MKLLESSLPSVRTTAPHGRRGFTLPELMVTLAIFSMVVLAVVSINLFGMRMIELTEPKMLADAEAQRMFNIFMEDVRNADTVEVLDGGTPTNQGNILQLALGFPTDTKRIRYELDLLSGELLRTAYWEGGTGEPEEFRLIASGVSAAAGIFSKEDHLGRLLTNDMKRFVVGMRLQFSQLHPTTYPVEEGQRFEEYQLRTKVAFRSP
jgi:prepilin-type N-terminal cleavage/methylation domain-containing protein